MELSHIFLMLWAALSFWELGQIWLIQIVIYPLFAPAVPGWMSAANILTGIIGLLVTVLLEIPRHNRLQAGGKNDTLIAELIRYNWLRTLSITAQSVITLLMLFHVFGAA
jgi:hypothetical protein